MFIIKGVLYQQIDNGTLTHTTLYLNLNPIQLPVIRIK